MKGAKTMVCRIESMEAFKDCLENKSNFIIITDSSNPTKIHKANCSYVKQEDFQEKVIDNKCKNGRYYCCASLNEAIGYALNELNEEVVGIEDLKCQKCLKSKKGVKKMNDFDLHKILKVLSKERPVFHSEADFQHALAWAIHEKYSDLKIRLEKRVELNSKKKYLDIFAFNHNKKVPIEVKYKTKNFETTVKKEKFNLKNQRARDLGRYDFIKDISRLEEASEKYHGGVGFAIFLTNDENYWKTSKNDETAADKDFRIPEGKTINGKLCWKEGTSKGTMRGREEPITLNGKYDLEWKNYSNLEGKNGQFRYLLIEVKHGNGV